VIKEHSSPAQALIMASATYASARHSQGAWLTGAILSRTPQGKPAGAKIGHARFCPQTRPVCNRTFPCAVWWHTHGTPYG
jgi:hypothetical protein